VPGVKAIHIENTRKQEEWSGLNIYLKGNEVRVFFLPREDRAKRQLLLARIVPGRKPEETQSFGTRSEHTGELTLVDWLAKHGLTGEEE